MVQNIGRTIELLNSEIENQVQGGGKYSMDFSMPGGSATNALTSLMSISGRTERCRTVQIGPCPKYYVDRRGGCSGEKQNYITCTNYEVSDCAPTWYIKPKDADISRVLSYYV